MRLDILRAGLYIAGMGKTNNSYRGTAVSAQDSKEYEKHTCGECAHCTPVTAFHTLTVKDRQPTLGRCPEEKFCVLLSQRACKKFSTKQSPGSV